MNENPMRFDQFFQAATGLENPLAYQCRLACGDGARLDNPETLTQGRECRSLLINVPTGLGKTAAVVLAWLWNRVAPSLNSQPSTINSSQWPRRLVYCLPMRTLVEQTESEVRKWLQKLLAKADELGIRGQMLEDLKWLAEHSPVVLMGGEELDNKKREWHNHPEHAAIIIGTQDMLLSRALNRGYASGRARWPKDFALLNNDCVWVFDEVQLMGSGFATSLQLQAWRQRLDLRPLGGGFLKPAEDTIAAPTFSWWMSATLERAWLDHGVDYRKQVNALWTACGAETKRLWGKDRTEDERVEVLLTQNRKSLRPVTESRKATLLKLKEGSDAGYLDHLADDIQTQLTNLKHGQLVLVIVNTVARAISLAQHEKLKSAQRLLLHSRFRVNERKEWGERLRDAQRRPRLIIATQVVEAGVDLSADVLFTEACPWPSFIQRVGRCARGFDWRESKAVSQQAAVFWTDVSEAPAPYEGDEVKEVVNELPKLKNEANLAALKSHADQLSASDRHRLLPYEPRFVPRDKDLFDLFDTAPDLTGADVDIARFIRDGDELDVQVFWRDCSELPREKPPKKLRPEHDELCPVPRSLSEEKGVGFHQFAQQALQRRSGRIWRWDYRDGWTRLTQAETDRIYAGQIFLLEPSCGGYRAEVGWTGNPDDQAFSLGPWKTDAQGSKPEPEPCTVCGRIVSVPSTRLTPVEAEDPDATEDSDEMSKAEWQSICRHSVEVGRHLKSLLADAQLAASVAGVEAILLLAARLHDWGKAHAAFEAKLKLECVSALGQHRTNNLPLAKAPPHCWRHDGLERQRADTAESARDRRRPGFRHEVASVLAILETLHRARPDHDALAWPSDPDLRGAFRVADDPAPDPLPPEARALAEELANLSAEQFDLLLYLVAAHHGKVRMSLRGSPDDTRTDVPDPCPEAEAQARGVREGDSIQKTQLPDAALGETLTAPSVTLHLDPMELGLSPRYGPSWRERTQALLEHWGPFRLAWFETLLRIADARASRETAMSSKTTGRSGVSSEMELREEPPAVGTPEALSPAEQSLVVDLVADGLSIQEKFRPEPLYKQTGKGHYASDTVEDIRQAKESKPKGGKS
ncbi:MAG: DEAD/DEAH box helicase [Verrucomicrobia bacterium]|nr:DEAD/DEAH box helicase [Verrucomicrobiota bacterium]